MFNTIGIGIAFSPNLKANIHEAVRFATAFNSRLVFIHVGAKSIEEESMLTELLKPYEAKLKEYEVVFKEGHPVDVILTTSKEKNVDLLLLGAVQRENIVKYYMGSIARKISRLAPCSILLLTHPSFDEFPINHIVVNGLKNPKTANTLKSAFYFASRLKSKKITIVEEITQHEVAVKVSDDRSLRRSTIVRERLKMREDLRVKKLLDKIPNEQKTNLNIKTQAIFGKRGYSIGHYAEVARADLLVMNAPSKLGLWDRIFPHDLEYILTELPSDVLIIR